MLRFYFRVNTTELGAELRRPSKQTTTPALRDGVAQATAMSSIGGFAQQGFALPDFLGGLSIFWAALLCVGLLAVASVGVFRAFFGGVAHGLVNHGVLLP